MITRHRKPGIRTLVFTCFTILFSSLAACSGAKSTTASDTPTRQSETSETEGVVNPPVPGKAISAGEYFRFDNYSLEDGLSQSTVFSILQDSEGYVWFGTEDGLNRFDGYSFIVYKHDPEDLNSLSSNWIQTMIEDDSGRLWIGTRDGGLNRFDKSLGKFTHFRGNLADSTGLQEDNITALHQDEQGMIWIGTGGGGLERLDPTTGRFTHFRHDPDNTNSLSENSILSIHQSKDGILWIGTDGGGLNRLDRETGAITIYRNDPAEDQSVISDSVHSILEDSSGALWIGTDAGLDRLDRSRSTFTHFQNDPDDPSSLSHNTVQVIFEDVAGSLWIGTYGGGLDYFDPATESFNHVQNAPGNPESISSNIILSIVQDREGILWFGTIGGGVNKLNPGRVNFTHYKNEPLNDNSLNSNMVRTFHQDQDGTIWVGTMFGGLNHFDPQAHRWQSYRNDPTDPFSLSDDFISTVYRDRSGVLWVGTIHGLDRLDPASKDFSHFNVGNGHVSESSRIEVTAIHESLDGTFWVGTTNGFYAFDREEEDWNKRYDFNPGSDRKLYVYIIREDRNGFLWIGTLGDGLFRLNPATGEFSQYRNLPGDPESLSQDFITAMFIDPSGRIWIGTNGTGLDMFDPETNTFEHYREEDGLPNDSIYCLLGDESGNLWISTNHGLSRFEPEEVRFTNYDVTEGLQSNEFNANACLRTIGGEMLFGGIDGFNMFRPESIQSNPITPQIVLTSMSMNNEAINAAWAADGQTGVVLRWPVDSVEFEYAALSYAQPEKNQYAYYLDGFEETWKEVGARRFGQYTNLPGGTYTLRITGSNNDGIWNETGIAVPITVVPPFWQTRWFYGLALVAILSLLYGGYRLRVQRLEMRGRELEREITQRTEELLQIQANLKRSEMEKAITAERNRLARDLHDSVTQSIYSLTLLAEAGQRMIQGGNITHAKENQHRLGEIAQQALQEMRLLVYELRPQVLQTEGLIGALEHRLETVERRAGINARMNSDDPITVSPKIEEELYHISMEALNNALKHAKASEVVLSLHTNGESLHLTIEDNGKGFDPEIARKTGGLGLSNMLERAKKFDGTLKIDSEAGCGTCIQISVPLHTKHMTAENREETT